MKIDLSEETVTFMRKFTHNLKTQDRRGTADPYFYTIRCHQEYAAPVGHTGHTGYFHPEYCETFTPESAAKHCEENEIDLETFLSECDKFDFQEIQHNENFFFTKDGYDQHMKLNSHNYRHYKKVYDYVDYAARNPELESILKLFGEIEAQL